MSDFDFDKAFADDLGKDRPFEPADGSWNKVEAALEASKNRERRRRMLLLLLVPLVLVSAFSALGTALYRNAGRMDAMQAEISQLRLQVSDKKSTVTSDTIIHHIAVIQYDTIFRTVIIRNRVAMDFYANNPAQYSTYEMPGRRNPKDKSVFSGTTAPTEKGPLTPDVPKVVSADTSAMINPDATSLLRKETAGAPAETRLVWAGKNAIPALPQRNNQVLESRHKERLPDLGLTMVPRAPEKMEEKLVRRFRPHNVALGVTSGLLYPQVAHLQHFSVWSIGLNAELFLGRQLRLRAGADYVPTRFQVDPFGQHDWNIPQLTPPTPDDVLRFVTINQPLWDFSMGFTYFLRPDKRLHPFGSAAWLGELTQGQALQYEYLNPGTENNTYIRMHRDDSRFNPGGFQLGLGAEYVLVKRLLFQFESQYQRQISRAPRMSGRWSLKTGLLYRF